MCAITCISLREALQQYHQLFIKDFLTFYWANAKWTYITKHSFFFSQIAKTLTFSVCVWHCTQASMLTLQMSPL